jgi:hypothetical protein
MVLLGWDYGPVRSALWSRYGSFMVLLWQRLWLCDELCSQLWLIYLYVLVGGNVLLMLCPVLFGIITSSLCNQ